MKNFLLILICGILIIPFSGCKKKSFDPTTKGQNDFIGTWKGSISTFKNNKLYNETGTVVIFAEADGQTLGGIIFMNSTRVFHQFQFVNGTLYFKVDCNDPNNPDCQKWNLSGYAVFSEEGKVDIRINGNECGTPGNEFIDWNGNLSSTQVPDDSLQYYHFAKAGNSWSYRITKVNLDSCTVQKQISISPSAYNFQGLSTQTCGWTGPAMMLKWSLLPYRFSILNDSTFSQKGVSFPIDAKAGVVYRTIAGGDTMTVTLIDTNLNVTTAAGTFNCKKFQYTEPYIRDSVRRTKSALLWLNVRYGVIKQEVQNPVDSADIKKQELSVKNF